MDTSTDTIPMAVPSGEFVFDPPVLNQSSEYNKIHSKIPDINDIFRFTLSNVNVSIANSIRRTILSDIRTVGFKTTPYSESDAQILTNTSLVNNEILCQRISSIPVFMDPERTDDIENYIMELDVQNVTDTIIVVTTKDFKVRDIRSDKYLDTSAVQDLFPPNPITGDYIMIVKLRPKLSDAIVGGHIKMLCTFSIQTAAVSGTFSVASLCSYRNSLNEDQINIEYEKMRQIVEDVNEEGLTSSEMSIKMKDWTILNSKRIYVPNSFDFIIQSIGVFSNPDIVKRACQSIISRIEALKQQFETGVGTINETSTTMNNGFDIILDNTDHTIGKIVEYALLHHMYEGSSNVLTFCGFRKIHPHDTFCTVRVAYKTNTTTAKVVDDLVKCMNSLILLYTIIQQNIDQVQL